MSRRRGLSYTVALEGLEALTDSVGRLDEEIARPLLRLTAARLQTEIDAVARDELHSTYDTYIAAVASPEVDVGNRSIKIGLADTNEAKFARMLEIGVPAPMDMRSYLIPAGEEYADIRFVHKGVGTSAKPPGAPIDKPYREALGQEKAAALGRKTLRDLRKRGPGGRLPAHTDAPVLENRTTGAQHRSDLYGGMRKQHITKGGNPVGSARAMTFRRISHTSGDPGTWIYPATPPKHILRKAAARTEARMDEIISAVVLSVVRSKL